jgi:hypothetical protein
MRTWSDWPLESVTPLAEVAAKGAKISVENGQSKIVYESRQHPGWLVKLFKPGFPEEPDAVLDELIALPGTMRPRDLAVVDAAMCWPVSRVVNDRDRTVGVIFAKAPREFFAKMRLLTGTQDCAIEFDQLIENDPARYRQWGWARPTPRERMLVSRNLLEVAALFERYGVVYGDWSYANGFWARETGKVFLIDIDSCGLGTRAWVKSPNWDDPLAEPGTRLDVTTDRYKIAVMVLRCLTGLRGAALDAHAALPAELRTSGLGCDLYDAITQPRDKRPLCGALLEQVETELDALPPPTPPPPRSNLRPTLDATPIAIPEPPLPEPIHPRPKVPVLGSAAPVPRQFEKPPTPVPEPERFVEPPALEPERFVEPPRRQRTRRVRMASDQVAARVAQVCGALLVLVLLAALTTLLFS